MQAPALQDGRWQMVQAVLLIFVVLLFVVLIMAEVWTQGGPSFIPSR